ncbi:MAG: type II secretion system protein GspF [Rhodospirillaceae bacterium]|nr:type II secretion system protein GspF [Rhodospirillaceae bacterium]|tara:strand:+ start:3771 stop:4988 length:1218 start_codon:yes stop_codon:yes gene_type:complete
MGAYHYVAVDNLGKEKKGVIEGDTPRQVRQILRDRSLLPIEVSEVKEKTWRTDAGKFSLRRGISALQLALLTRQLSTLLRAGLPLDEALQAVSEQTESPRIRTILFGVRSRVLEGHTLASGLDDFPRVFPHVYRATVSAGEQAGKLDSVLERLADYTESRHSLRQKISHAMIYPMVLTGMSITIVTLMLIYVVPKVVGVFETTGQSLPLLTRTLIMISTFLQNWWFMLLTAIVLVGFGIKKLLGQEVPRRRFHQWILSLPIFGRVTKGLNTARFTRTLSILSSSGVPILEALKISGSVITNLPMSEAVEEATVRVREGEAIGRSLAQSKIFPAMSIHLISSGEASGELENMLERAAKHQENEMDSLLGTMLGILEPLLIIIMGLLVLTIVMAILLPIFQINQLVA